MRQYFILGERKGGGKEGGREERGKEGGGKRGMKSRIKGGRTLFGSHAIAQRQQLYLSISLYACVCLTCKKSRFLFLVIGREGEGVCGRGGCGNGGGGRREGEEVCGRGGCGNGGGGRRRKKTKGMYVLTVRVFLHSANDLEEARCQGTRTRTRPIQRTRVSPTPQHYRTFLL